MRQRHDFREFRREDAMELEGVALHYPVMGITFELEGRVAGYAGFWTVNGRQWAFLHVDELARKHWVMLARNTRDFIQSFQERYPEIFTLCDLRYPNAQRFMSWLGFVPMVEADKTPDILFYEEMARNVSGAKAWVRRA
jgi:hypothetical protein